MPLRVLRLYHKIVNLHVNFTRPADEGAHAAPAGAIRLDEAGFGGVHDRLRACGVCGFEKISLK